MSILTGHVVNKLSAYCNGELGEAQSTRVAEHLLKCPRCRREYDVIHFGVQLAQQLPDVSAPADIWNEIEALLDARAHRPVARPAFNARRAVNDNRPRWVAVAALVLVAFAGLVVYLAVVRHFRPSSIQTGQDAGSGARPNSEPCLTWPVTTLAGTPRIDGGGVSGGGCFGVGELLETDGQSRAQISVPKIGEVEIEPNSRVRLIATRITEHRLSLERGKLKASIVAPPRLFFVNTPSAEAIDLGCAYTLEVDDAGRGLLHVTSGWVMLVRDGRESYVPIGAMCETRPGLGPGTPFFEDASASLRTALTRYDFEDGGEAALETVLDQARERDSFTLWHLLQRVDGATRVRVLDRMIALVGRPRCVSRAGILRLDRRMLDCWKDELDTTWF